MIEKQRISDRGGEKNGRSKITSDQAADIREKYSTGIYKQSDLAKEYGLSNSAIAYITRGEHWKNSECTGICGV